MRQAHARKVTDAYLDAPRRSERHLRVVDEDRPTARVADEDRPTALDEAHDLIDADLGLQPALRRRIVEDLRVEAPRITIPEPDPLWDTAFAPDPEIADPDWAKPFADPRWDDRIGEPAYEERDGRRTVLVTGRPAGSAMPRRDSTPAASARLRRQSPTRARLAGRPDRVALWAVCLGLLMAAIAGVSGNGPSSTQQLPVEPTPSPILER